MIKHAVCQRVAAMLSNTTSRTYVATPCGSLVASRVAAASYSCRSSSGHHGLQSGRPLLRPAAAMLPDDFDAMIIGRKSLSSLQPPRSHPLPGTVSSSSSSNPASASSSMDETGSSSASETSEGMTLEDIKDHKRAAVQQAFLNGTLGFGFSAGGLVFPYYVGLVSSLVQRGVLTRPTQLAGSSAGSLIAASFNAGLDMATVEQSLIAFGEDCLKNGTRYRLGPLLRDFLHQVLPQDAHELCRGNTHVAVTRLLPYWQTVMVSDFHSRDDLITALLTSCHIPWYFDGRWMTKFRGHYCVDGGVMAFIPSVPKADYTVKVMCFPSSHLERLKATTRSSRRLKKLHDLLDIDITMDTYDHWPYDLQQILKWALVASATETSSLLIEKGKKDASLWLDDMQLEPLVRQKQQQEAQQQQQQGERMVDVGWGSGGGTARTGDEQARDEAAAADWADHGGDRKRKAEAEQAQGRVEDLEAAVAASTAPDGSGDRGAAMQDVAAAAGVDERVIKHAADAVDVAEPMKKKHKVVEVAATAAAAAGKLGDTVKQVVGGGSTDEHRSSSNSSSSGSGGGGRSQ